MSGFRALGVNYTSPGGGGVGINEVLYGPIIGASEEAMPLDTELADMIRIPGGSHLMGSDKHYSTSVGIDAARLNEIFYGPIVGVSFHF